MTTPARLPETARILIVRLRRSGDLLLLTPTMRAIRATYPNASIDLLALDGFHNAVLGSPHLNRVIVLKPGTKEWQATIVACARGHYDALLDFQSSPRSLPFVVATHAKVRVGWRKRNVRDWVYTHRARGWDDPIYLARNFLRLASLIGVPLTSDLQLDLAITEGDRQHTDAIFAQAGIGRQRPVIALSVVSKVDRKRWPAQHYAELADRLIDARNAQLVFTSGPGEMDQVRAVVERMRRQPSIWNYGSTTLGALASIYERCDLWIGNDGGPKHVATAAKCPTLVIIKAGDERFWTDTSDPSQVAVCDPRPEEHPADSLEGVTATLVFEAATKMLARARLH